MRESGAWEDGDIESGHERDKKKKKEKKTRSEQLRERTKRAAPRSVVPMPMLNADAGRYAGHVASPQSPVPRPQSPVPNPQSLLSLLALRGNAIRM